MVDYRLATVGARYHESFGTDVMMEGGEKRGGSKLIEMVYDIVGI